MRVPFLSLFITSSFEGLCEHAEKVKECTWTFQQAIECYFSDRCERFEEMKQEIVSLEKEADAIKRRIRGHLPKWIIMSVDKFQLFRYLKEQDNVLDSVEEALNWMSYRDKSKIPEKLREGLLLLVESVIDAIDEMSLMVSEAKKYFDNFSDKHRKIVKNIIVNIREKESLADEKEAALKRKIFEMKTDDAVTIFHIVRLTEIIGSIADYAENAGDMMRAMLAR
mmetsp:Transcript_11428/g.5748  ORF Transcript_11428/g.5748 Transcript_11428/m.5748 type:complete len:224 (-) Transcript_11428:36-707(-)